ncbi:MAG: hypothetical protein CL916_02530 [Deltaproteobacteria bacterium]|nr:hypothetical protein [Deltaproteobacteria bacterium]
MGLSVSCRHIGATVQYIAKTHMNNGTGAKVCNEFYSCGFTTCTKENPHLRNSFIQVENSKQTYDSWRELLLHFSLQQIYRAHFSIYAAKSNIWLR